MAEHTTHAAAQRTEPAHGQTEPHASDATYVWIAVILAVITAIEVWTYYAPQLGRLLIPLLLLLSAAKFSLVAGYYMHLKFDSRLFTGFFVSGLAVAAAVIVSFLALFKGLF